MNFAFKDYLVTFAQVKWKCKITKMHSVNLAMTNLSSGLY